MTENFAGYDISPDMVRLSRVNMYLHKFTKPKIYEYDTLTSLERWDETYDVILANPPFMTPKGGIIPHNRYRVPAKRSEVLFVDYIAEHLNPTGKAGIIVPEGIVFQSAGAYKSLRKFLVDDGLLYAVISLPSGVFNPYSGVKTCILLFDRKIAKQKDEILFVKINNDGYGLGAQRRETTGSDIPDVIKILKDYKEGKDVSASDLATIASKKDISGQDYILVGDRYKTAEVVNSEHAIVELGSVCEIITGFAFKSELLLNEKSHGALPVIKIGNLDNKSYLNLDSVQYLPYDESLEKYLINKNDILLAMTGATVGKVSVSRFNRLLLNQRVANIRVSGDKINSTYLMYLLFSEMFYEYCQANAGGGAQGNISPTTIKAYKIPLPPLNIQEEIVKEIEGFQKIIDGARQVVENYKPIITLDPNWEMIELGNVCQVIRGSSPRPAGDQKYYGGNIPRLMVADVTRDGMYVTPKIDFLTEEGAKLSRPMQKGDLVMAVSGQPGTCAILNVDACIHDGFAGFKEIDNNKVCIEFLYFYLMRVKEENNNQSVGAVFKNLKTEQIRNFLIPIPDLDIQKKVVNEMLEEVAIIDQTKRLIEIFEQKIKDKISKIWGE